MKRNYSVEPRMHNMIMYAINRIVEDCDILVKSAINRTHNMICAGVLVFCSMIKKETNPNPPQLPFGFIYFHPIQ